MDGMDNDSTLVSVELDDSLQSVARDALAGDERVTWVLGDGSDWLRAAVERPELVQEVQPVPDLAAVRRVEEREVLHVAEPRGRHL